MSEFNSTDFWESLYKSGGISGTGSYGHLAEFKANVINNFLIENNINTVIEFGCGDGNQLGYMQYKNYLGLDVSQSAVDRCNSKFSNDSSKSFLLYNPLTYVPTEKYDLAVCLDVLYHISDDIAYEKTLQDIFSSSNKYVILYTIFEDYIEFKPYREVIFRDIFKALEKITDFKIKKIVKQKYINDCKTDFIILEKIN